jgi:hypothetical protein
MSAIEQLFELVVPPPERFSYDWAEVERQLGTALPADFKQLAEIYGPGEFDETFTLHAPTGDGARVDLVPAAREQADTWRSIREDVIGGGPLVVFPEPGGLLAWGMVPIGLALCWQTEGAPDRWPVVVCDDTSLTVGVSRFDGPASEFLLAVLLGEAEIPYLADTGYCPAEPPRFTSLALRHHP